MSLRSRLKLLEAHAPDPRPRGSPDDYPTVTLAAAVGELDGLIRRLDEQVREAEENPASYVKSFDDAVYGETLDEHKARVDDLMDAIAERDEAWRREHRPGLAGVPNEIDAHIAEIEAEIAILEAGGRVGS